MSKSKNAEYTSVSVLEKTRDFIYEQKGPGVSYDQYLRQELGLEAEGSGRGRRD